MKFGEIALSLFPQYPNPPKVASGDTQYENFETLPFTKSAVDAAISKFKARRKASGPNNIPNRMHRQRDKGPIKQSVRGR